jgi:N-acetylmuramoyl-L-alanine amidase
VTDLRDTRSLTTPERILEDVARQFKIKSSFELARALQAHYPFRVKEHAIRQAPFFVNLYNRIPSVLIELGYLTHSQERRLLQDVNHQAAIVRGLASGIRHFLKEASAVPFYDQRFAENSSY